MRKERIETLVDSFVDENGVERKFVIAAVSEVLPKTLAEQNPKVYGNAEDGDCGVSYEVVVYDEWDGESLDQLVKSLKIGFAICNPNDEFNEELGLKIAIGRARKNNTCALYATELGYINTKLVKAFLEQEAEYFKRNPESRIAGYKRK